MKKITQSILYTYGSIHQSPGVYVILINRIVFQQQKFYKMFNHISWHINFLIIWELL